MKMFKPNQRLLCLIIAVLLLFSSCGEKDGKGSIFGYDITTNPKTLDPQCAVDYSSLLLIDNVFEGLFKMDNKGNLQLGVASGYTVSDDGLKYTFSMRENSWWIDVNEFSAQVTASDFVFAFQRLFTPDTRASRSSDFLCIKNSKAIKNGEIKDLSQLGVKALDNFTLQISLEYPNPSLPVLLATAAAMPCNEEYFIKSQGRYGLTAKTTPSNGAFYLKSWNYDKWSSENNNLVLRYNEKYNKADEVMPLGLNFFIEEQKDLLSNFLNGSSQSIVAKGDDAQRLLNGNYSFTEHNTTTIGIMLNTKSATMSNAHFRYALAYSADKSQIKTEEGFKIADAIIPSDITINGTNYREKAGDTLDFTVDLVKAKASYEKAQESLSKEDIDEIKLITSDDEYVLKYVNELVQIWQSNLGFYCNVVAMSESELNTALKNKDYTIAVTQITGDYNSPSAYLERFVSENSYNYSGVNNSDFEKYLQRAERSGTLEDGIDYYKKAEKELLNECVFIPLVYRTEYFFLGKDCEDIIYNPFTKSVTYIKAKCYV